MLEALILIFVAVTPQADLSMEILEPLPDASGRIYPKAGSRVSLRILEGGNPAKGAKLEAIHLPGSEVSKTVEVGRTREDGTIEWTPHAAGIVTLVASVERSGEGKEKIREATTLTLSVRFEKFSWQGIAVFLFAGSLLFGGLFLSYRKLVS
ncbi:MAG: hypothetical protein O7H41_03175 [Planctomycetota bacterium]|nr:hypothetical protein [Planctomycetota bacterium]